MPIAATTAASDPNFGRGARPRPTWWTRFREFLRPPRRLKFTREGRYFFFISLAVGFAAVNTGNNLLYLLLGMTLSLIVASGLLSELTLRRLTVRRGLPGEIYAERPFLVGVELLNQKRRASSYSIEIEDRADGVLLEKKCYFLKIPPERTQHTSYRFAFATRGLHHFESVQLSTKFPFALFRKSKSVPLADEVLVYPARVDVSDLLAGASVGVGEAPSRRAGSGEDFFAIRELRLGEDPRTIHWKSTARAGRLMVREAEEASSRRVTLCLDNHNRDPLDKTHAAAIERAIARTASLAAHFIERGYRVRVVTRTAQVAEGAGRAHLRAILRTLALLDVPSGGTVEPLTARPTERAIFVSAGPPKGTP
jgi:uncharacterized protein (DUF58 family)